VLEEIGVDTTQLRVEGLEHYVAKGVAAQPVTNAPERCESG
jgi:hypothetical protein